MECREKGNLTGGFQLINAEGVRELKDHHGVNTTVVIAIQNDWWKFNEKQDIYTVSNDLSVTKIY